MCNFAANMLIRLVVTRVYEVSRMQEIGCFWGGIVLELVWCQLGVSQVSVSKGL